MSHLLMEMALLENWKLMAAWLKNLQNVAGKPFGGCFLGVDSGLEEEMAMEEGSSDSKDDKRAKQKSTMNEAYSFEWETRILRDAAKTNLNLNFDNDDDCDAELEGCSWAAFGLAVDEGQ